VLGGRIVSRTVKTILTVVGIVLVVLVALHVFAAPMMDSLRETIHGIHGR
jgi:hypothetical protein